MIPTPRWALTALVCLSATTALAACGSSDDKASGNNTTNATKTTDNTKGGTIALLLPETKTTRYELHDRPTFVAKVQALCPACKIDYANANQDPVRQQQQAEAAITKGAKVLVLDAVDAKAAVATVNRAKAAGIPVIAYDRLITGAPIAYYVSFNNVKVGELQAQTLIDKIGAAGRGKSIVMLNGSPTDPSSGDYKRGAHSVLDHAQVRIGKEYDTQDWSPDKAEREMEQAITALGKDRIVGVYSANDGMASGAIAAMKGGGIDPKSLPTTGQDSEVAAIQRILVGDQYMTIYLRIKKQAEASAEIAVALAQGKQPPAGLVNAKTDNGAGQVPSVLLAPTAVTKDNIKDTIIADDFLTSKEICINKFAAACKAAGIN
ncbi:sugar ABC transporter substrate-binding protein [Conexibacter woesei]|uniref:ABC transporter substrate-binding protein n=1 Tax=Conexibacter woesei TaxID=191495 RepID=UPI00041A6821|nr:sugar ABC transporter substrate-binding protein [Conexibacter woesei]